MHVEDAQREVRTVFLGGFVGQLVSGTLWLASGALATWGSPRLGILALVIGGPLIFPLTQLSFRAMGRPASLSSANPLGALAMQIAFTIPLVLPVAGGAALYRLNWFYPACAIIVGAHYLPFVFLYGMREFAVLGGVLIAGGLLIALYAAGSFATAAWFTAATLFVFAFVLRAAAARREG
jgi:hypothetical protein